MAFLVIVAGIAGYAVWRGSHPAAPTTAQGGGGGRGGGRGRGGGALGPVPVVVTSVTRSSIPNYLNGRTWQRHCFLYTVTVKSRVDGQYMKADFNEGDFVKQGQVLAELDPRPFQAQLDLVQATLAHDQALLDNAKVDLVRYQKLLAEGVIPSQQTDTQTALVAQYNGTIKQDQANTEKFPPAQLTYAKVTAPISGTVGLRIVDPGNIVHSSDAAGIVTITQLQPIAVLFTIPKTR